jgi:hypothetical protein
VTQTEAPGASSLVLLFVLSIAVVPLTYIGHEGGHYLAARAMGARAVLHYDQVELIGGAVFTPLQRAAFAAAGPAVDWAVGLTGLLLLCRRYTPTRFLSAIWVGRPVQFLPALLGLDALYFGRGEGLEGSDEAVVAHALNVPPATLVWVEIVVVAIALAVIAWALPAGRRLLILPVSACGVMIGWAGWLLWGNLVLP